MLDAAIADRHGASGVIQSTIALVLPTLNELPGLQATLPWIDRSLFDQIIVIDGGSRDGTVEYAMEMGLTVVSQIRPGLHYAIYDLVHTLTTDYVVEFSPDGNCKVEQLPELIAKLREGRVTCNMRSRKTIMSFQRSAIGCSRASCGPWRNSR